MKANRSYLKGFAICASFIILMTLTIKAQATYIYNWIDYGQEWYMAPDGINVVTVPSSEWDGFFTVPDSAVEHWTDGDYNWHCIDVNQRIDFALNGMLLDGTLFSAKDLYGEWDGAQAVQDAITELYEIRVGYIYITMDDLTIRTTFDDHWLEYTTTIFDHNTNGRVPVTVSHDGYFVGRHIDDAAPVPEPATMILLGCGLAGIVGTKLRKKK